MNKLCIFTPWFKPERLCTTEEICLLGIGDVVKITYLDDYSIDYISKHEAHQFLLNACTVKCDECRFRFICLTSK